MTTVTVEIPEEVFALAGMSEGSTSDRTAKLRAAELAGVGVEEFMEFSAHRQVSLHYSADDLVEDRATASRQLRDLRG